MTFEDFFNSRIDESLEIEKQMFDNPQDELSLEIDEEDSNEGVLHYMGYDFPISKRGTSFVEYIVGNVAKSIVVRGNGPNAFIKVIQAIDQGKVPAVTQSNSSIYSKVQRDIPQTVTIELANGKTKDYYYVEPGKVDALVTKIYDEFGPDKYQEQLKLYATDRPSGDMHNPYIPVSQTARQNVFRHKLGTKQGAINYKSK